MAATEKRTARTEFPTYPMPETVGEAVKAGVIEDTSWHNDSCPSFQSCGVNRREGLRLWIDHSRKDLREMGGERCMVTQLKYGGRDAHGHHWRDDECEPVLKTESVHEALDFVTRFACGVAVGDRVRFKVAHDVYPFAQVSAGDTGTVVRVSKDTVAVKADRYHAGLDDWGNEVHLEADSAGSDEDMAEFVLSVVERI